MENIKNYSKDIEKQVLAYMFSDKKYIAFTLDKVNESNFVNFPHCYLMLTKYYARYKDVITDKMINNYFDKRQGIIDTNTMVMYETTISEIKEIDVINENEFLALINILQDIKDRREILNLAEKIVTTNPIDCSKESLNKVKSDIKKVLSTNNGSQLTRKKGLINKALGEMKKNYQEVKENPDKLRIIPTGFKVFDDAEGGLRPSELLYVIGRKGDGKSVFLLNLAYQVWEAGYNVFLASFEMAYEDYLRRFVSRGGKISSNGIKRGKLEPHVEKELFEILDKMEQGYTPKGKKAGQFYIADIPKKCNTNQIEIEIEEAEVELGIKFDLIVLDYAGIMKSNTSNSEKRHEQGDIALELKGLARSKDYIVATAAQMNRKGKDDLKQRTGSEHIAEADAIADHIDLGVAIKSISDTQGKIESFKTRDAAPFDFYFKKDYQYFLIDQSDIDTNVKNDWNIKV